MKCKIDGCSRDLMYQEQQVCQMHYFRFMRNGHYNLTPATRKYRVQNPAGYQKLFEPRHKLANSDGYVYEHRMVYHDQVDINPVACSMCGKRIDWGSLHIDHIDDDVTNNCKSNLRATCRACNTMQGHSHTSYGKNFVTVMGFSLSAHTWSRHPACSVSGATILRRLRSGLTAFDSVFNESKTLKRYKRKVSDGKYDEAMGVSEIFTKITEELERRSNKKDRSG